jgi:hypothetical protein
VQPVLADYDRPDNPLFVPEAQFRAGTAFLALGRHHAIGFSVFGVDDGRTDGRLARAYAVLWYSPAERDLLPGRDLLHGDHNNGSLLARPATAAQRRTSLRRGDRLTATLYSHVPCRAWQ